MTRDVLLVGSVGLNNAEEVFRTVGSMLGKHVKRIPDGETGWARSVWTQCQRPFFLGNPALEMVEKGPDGYVPARVPAAGIYGHTLAETYRGRARLRPGVSPTDLAFHNPGYADWAEESYTLFVRLKREGVLPEHVRFQVCLPDPAIIVNMHALRAFGLGAWARPWVADPAAAIWTVLVVLIWQFSGLMMMFYLAGLHSISEEVDEAAAVDGAGWFAQVWHITLPLLAPALTVALTFSAVLGLRVFDQVVALTNGGPAGVTETLATQVYKQTWALGRFGYGAAFALLLSAFVGLVAIAQLVVLRRREQQMA